MNTSPKQYNKQNKKNIKYNSFIKSIMGISPYGINSYIKTIFNKLSTLNYSYKKGIIFLY